MEPACESARGGPKLEPQIYAMLAMIYCQVFPLSYSFHQHLLDIRAMWDRTLHRICT
jgi:hypothetical protein